MAGGDGYAQRHLQQSDYFDQKRTVEGQWHGRGAELLGLSGRVSPEDFESLRQGLDPETGEFLRQRQGSDRISADGAEQSKARSLYDMTFSAPTTRARSEYFRTICSLGSSRPPNGKRLSVG